MTTDPSDDALFVHVFGSTGFESDEAPKRNAIGKFKEKNHLPSAEDDSLPTEEHDRQSEDR